MKKRCIITLGLMALITLASCRRIIFEDRRACPSSLYFAIMNEDLFKVSDTVYAKVYCQPEDIRAGEATTSIREIVEHDFRFRVKKADAWSGYGLLGVEKSHPVNDAEWIIDEGEQADPLFRFAYRVPGCEEQYVAPVEFLKEHAKVTIRFVHIDRFTYSQGQFPFRLVIKGNTCGMDAKTGLPLTGPFRYEPEEAPSGTFHFILPRQADNALEMELWAKPGLYEREGLVDTFSLSALFRQQENVNWEAKNLPDIYLEVDYVESMYNITAIGWEEEKELIYRM